MSAVRTIIPNVSMDWDDQVPHEFRTDISRGAWESEVNKVLGGLYQSSRNATSKAVIVAYLSLKKTLLITPEKRPFGAAKLGRNAGANPTDPAAATAKGKDPERGPAGSGTGLGSDSVLTFTPQDWSPVSASSRLDVVDEVLLHELVHAVRQSAGAEDSVHLKSPLDRLNRGDASDTTLMAPAEMLAGSGETKPTTDKNSQIYNNIEEFVAVLITNIYRSEKGRPGLVRDHLGDNVLAWPMTNPRNFLSVWRTQITRLCNEIPRLCDTLATVDCAFNPIFELYAADNRFGPGGRSVKTGAGARPFRSAV